MGKLELRRDRGRLRHFLDDRMVEPGDRVEVLLSGGRWLVGTYDWNGVEARWPGLRFELGGAWERDPSSIARPPSGVMALHPDAVLRWPGNAVRKPSPGELGVAHADGRG
jgi:hypothetical protein